MILAAGLVVFGIGAIALIGTVVARFIAQGRWLAASALAVLGVALVLWVQWLAWRQSRGGPSG